MVPHETSTAPATTSGIRARHLKRSLVPAQGRGQSAHRARRERPDPERLGELVRDKICRQDDEISEGARPVQARIRLANAGGATAKEAIDLDELLERRLAIRPHQRIGQLHQHPVWLGLMDVGVRAVEVAQRALQPKSTRLEHEPLVPQLATRCSRDRQTKLKRHVEPWHAAPHVDPAQIMEGIATGRNQLEDAVEPRHGARQLQGRARSEAEPAKPGDERQKELLVARIVGNVQERVVTRVAFGDIEAIASARGRARRRWAGSLRGDGSPSRRLRLANARRLAGPLAALAEKKVDERRELPHPLLRHTEGFRRRAGRGVRSVDPGFLHKLKLRRCRSPCQFTAAAFAGQSR